MRKIIVLIALIPLFSTMHAQQSYTIEECRQMALENNRKIKSGALEIKVAEEGKKEAFTNYFPSLSAMGFGFKAKDPLISMSTESGPVGFLGNGMMGSLSLTQPVFVGGKIFYGNKLSKLATEVSKEQLRLSENEVLQNVENLYWELTSLKKKINTLNKLDEFLATLHADVELAYKTGLTTRNDLLEVKLQQNELKSSRVNLEDGIKLCKMSICQLIGIGADRADSFDVLSPAVNEVESPATYYVDHKEAVANRAESKLLDKNVEISKLQTKMKRADFLPTVAVGAIYYQNDFMDKWEGNSLLFVSVSVPLTDWWKGSHAIKQQKIRESISRNTQEDMQEKLLIQMKQVRNELDNAYRQLMIENESVEQAEENLRLNKDYYQAGTTKMSDLLHAQSLYQQRLDKRADAFSNYRKKSFEYLKVTAR